MVAPDFDARSIAAVMWLAVAKLAAIAPPGVELATRIEELGVEPDGWHRVGVIEAVDLPMRWIVLWQPERAEGRLTRERTDRSPSHRTLRFGSRDR